MELVTSAASGFSLPFLVTSTAAQLGIELAKYAIKRSSEQMGSLPKYQRALKKVYSKIYSLLRDARLPGLFPNYTLWVVVPSRSWMMSPRFSLGNRNLRSDESFDPQVAVYPSLDCVMLMQLLATDGSTKSASSDMQSTADVATGTASKESTDLDKTVDSYMPKGVNVLLLSPFENDVTCSKVSFGASPQMLELNLSSLPKICEKLTQDIENPKGKGNLLNPTKTTLQTASDMVTDPQTKKTIKILENRKRFNVYHNVTYFSDEGRATPGLESEEPETKTQKLGFLGYMSSFYLCGLNFENKKDNEELIYDVGVYRAKFEKPNKGLVDRQDDFTNGSNMDDAEGSWNGIFTTTTVLNKIGTGKYKFTPEQLKQMALGTPEGVLVFQKKYPMSPGTFKTKYGTISYPNNNVTDDMFKTEPPYMSYDFSSGVNNAKEQFYISFPSKSQILLQKVVRGGSATYVDEVYLFVRTALHDVTLKIKTNALRPAMTSTYLEKTKAKGRSLLDSSLPASGGIGGKFGAIEKMFCNDSAPEGPFAPCSSESCSQGWFDRLGGYFREVLKKDVWHHALAECRNGSPAHPIGNKYGYFFVTDGNEEARLHESAKRVANSACESFLDGTTLKAFEERKETCYDPGSTVSPKFLRKAKQFARGLARSPKKLASAARAVKRLKKGEPVRLGKSDYVVSVKKTPLPPSGQTRSTAKFESPLAQRTYEQREATKNALKTAKLEDRRARYLHQQSVAKIKRNQKIAKYQTRLDKLKPAHSNTRPDLLENEGSSAALVPAAEPPISSGSMAPIPGPNGYLEETQTTPTPPSGEAQESTKSKYKAPPARNSASGAKKLSSSVAPYLENPQYQIPYEEPFKIGHSFSASAPSKCAWKSCAKAPMVACLICSKYHYCSVHHQTRYFLRYGYYCIAHPNLYFSTEPEGRKQIEEVAMETI